MSQMKGLSGVSNRLVLFQYVLTMVSQKRCQVAQVAYYLSNDYRCREDKLTVLRMVLMN